MIKVKDPNQFNIFDPWDFLSPKRRKILDAEWPGLFREHILPSIPIKKVIKYFDPTFGRPTKELYSMLGALILQQSFDLTDEETVQQYSYNIQWHYSLLTLWSHVLWTWSEIVGFAWTKLTVTPEFGYPHNIKKGATHEPFQETITCNMALSVQIIPIFKAKTVFGESFLGKRLLCWHTGPKSWNGSEICPISGSPRTRTRTKNVQFLATNPGVTPPCLLRGQDGSPLPGGKSNTRSYGPGCFTLAKV